MISTEKAVIVAKNITEQLFAKNWQLRTEGDFGKPGNADTLTSDLPAVRVYPPDGKNEWFLELLSCPSEATISKDREFQRLETSQGHFALIAFGYFALLEYEPLETDFGIWIAIPEMMALCNLLHHPIIEPTSIKGQTFLENPVKRSNKDLGRVLALAYLTNERDPDALLDWADKWRSALIENFPSNAAELMLCAGSGIRALLASEEDLAQAYFTANVGLLASMEVSPEAFYATGERIISDVIDRIEYLSTLPIPK